MSSPAKIFCCYAHEDQALLKRLKIHLISLQRQDLITTWTDTDISPGANWEQEITKHINTARIILLLVSPDFIASDYCYSNEMAQALERDKRGDAHVIPIILRPVYWEKAPFHKLQALPKNAKPLTKWSNIDDGFLSIVEGILLAIKNLPQQPSPIQPRPSAPQQPPSVSTFSVPSANQFMQRAIPPAPQQPSTNASPLPVANQTPIQPRPSAPQQPPSVSTFSVPSANQFMQRAIPPAPQQPSTNVSPLPTANQTPIQPRLSAPQQPSISHVKKVNVSNISSLAFKLSKIILYFLGFFIAEFGFLGGSLVSTGTNKNLSNGLGGIAFFVGLVALLISTIIFFRKGYYSHHLHCAQYMWLIAITTISSIALLILGISVVPGNSTDPLKSAIIASVFILYGISLVVLTYLKPSSNKSPLLKGN